MFNCVFLQFSVLVLAEPKAHIADKIPTCVDPGIDASLVNMDSLTLKLDDCHTLQRTNPELFSNDIGLFKQEFQQVSSKFIDFDSRKYVH
jgi:hypothetical protein